MRTKVFFLSVVLVVMFLFVSVAMARPTLDNPSTDTVEVLLRNVVLDPDFGPPSTVYLDADGVYVRFCDDSQFRAASFAVTHISTYEHKVESYLSYPTLSNVCFKAREINVHTSLGGGYASGQHTFWISRESHTVTVP